MHSTILRCVLTTVATISLSLPASSQTPIKVDLVKYYGELIAPPLTAKEAFQKADCSDTTSGNCNSDALFTKLKATLDEHQKELASASLGGGTGDMMKKIQDPDFRKKMESMSQPEKMKMAMEIAQGAMKQPAPTTAEPAPVANLMRDLGKINEDIGKEDVARNEQTMKELARRQKVDGEHKVIEDWQTAEINKLPLIPDKVMEIHDPKGAQKIKLQAMDKHLAIVDRELKSSATGWKADLAREKLRYAKFGPGLAAIHYGEDAANDVSRQMITSAQSRIVNSLQMLAARSNTLWNDAATWYKKKVLLEQEKP